MGPLVEKASSELGTADETFKCPFLCLRKFFACPLLVWFLSGVTTIFLQ